MIMRASSKVVSDAGHNRPRERTGGGQVTGQAMINLGGSAPLAVAVTGGSDNYQGAE
jgi:hypothetical protein